jgi:citrate lyase subunit beta/citryl-CoA lyase
MTRLYRSIMFVPGNRPDMMDKAPRYEPDGIAFDLEDSVPPAEKHRARKIVRDAVARLSSAGPAMFVRLNGVQTGMTSEDVEAVVVPGLAGVLLPKPERREDVLKVDAWIELCERRAGMPVGAVKIMVLPETALGVYNIHELLTACPRVANLCAPLTSRAGDIVRDIGYKWTPAGLETRYLESHLLLAARAAGIEFPMAGGGIEVRNPERVREQFQRARETGYRGVFVIHPTQIPVAHEIFGLTREEIDWQKGVLRAMAAAGREGRAAATYDGMLVDYAHVRNAQQLLRQAESSGMDVGEYPQL